jgi:hypothetical protein
MSTKRNLFIFSNQVYQKEKTLFDQNVWHKIFHEAICCRIFENDHIMNLNIDIDHYLHWHVPK